MVPVSIHELNKLSRNGESSFNELSKILVGIPVKHGELLDEIFSNAFKTCSSVNENPDFGVFSNLFCFSSLKISLI